MDAAIVAYSVAMLVYAMEMLTAKALSPSLPALVSRRRAPALVGTGAAATPQADGAGTGTAAPHNADSAQYEQVALTDTGPGARSHFLGKVAVGVTVVGWLLHLGEIVTRGLAADRWPWGNMYEFTSTLCFAAVTTFLALMIRRNVRFLGLYLLALVVLGLGIDGAVLYESAGPRLPALDSYWITIHVTAAMIATGLFMVGAVLSTLYPVRGALPQPPRGRCADWLVRTDSAPVRAGHPRQAHLPGDRRRLPDLDVRCGRRCDLG